MGITHDMLPAFPADQGIRAPIPPLFRHAPGHTFATGVRFRRLTKKITPATLTRNAEQARGMQPFLAQDEVTHPHGHQREHRDQRRDRGDRAQPNAA